MSHTDDTRDQPSSAGGAPMTRPPLGRWDAAAVASVAALLLVAYVLVPTPGVQYGAWLTIFSV